MSCAVGALPAVTRLDGKYAGITANITVLGQLRHLLYLGLSGDNDPGRSSGHPRVIVGDIEALAPLLGLSYLDLGITNVTGNVMALASLLQLAYLNLIGAKVGGGVRGLASLVHLSHLNLAFTEVTGDPASLASLVRLT